MLLFTQYQRPNFEQQAQNSPKKMKLYQSALESSQSKAEVPSVSNSQVNASVQNGSVGLLPKPVELLSKPVELVSSVQGASQNTMEQEITKEPSVKHTSKAKQKKKKKKKEELDVVKSDPTSTTCIPDHMRY